jgi:hypothetical protein
MQKTFVVNQPSTVTVTVPDQSITETIVPINVPPTNKPPVANAGPDQAVKIPANGTSVVAVLNGSQSTDPEGNIKTYQWRKVSGGAAQIQSVNSHTTNVTLSSLGEYVFELRVIDTANLFSADTVRIVVTKDVVTPPVNQSPIANAGGDQSVQLPQNTLNIDGSLSHDPDGQIKAYNWQKVSGPAVTMFGADTALLQLSNLLEGPYVFRLTITDNNDATNSDQVSVTVKPAVIVEPPTANTYPFTLAQNKTSKMRHFAGFENWNGQNYASFPGGWKDYYFRFCVTDVLKGSNATVVWTRFDREIQKAITQGAGFSFGFMSVCDSDDFLAMENYGGASSRYPLGWHNQMQAESVKDFSRNGMWIPNWNSSSFQTNMANFLKLVNTRIETMSFNGIKYKDVINYADIRFYAQWGEWHNGGLFDNVSEFPAGTRPTVASYKKIIDAHCDAFPNYPLTVLFAGYDANWLPHTMTPPEVTDYLLEKRNAWGLIGWRRDQWGQTDNYIRDYLENNTRSFGDSGPFNQIIMERWKYAPVVGEPYGPGANLADLKNQVIKYHACSIGNGNYTGSDSNSQNLFKAAAEEAGAKISLNKGELRVSTAFDFDITMTVENFGNSPVYNDRLNLVYELRSSSNQVVWTSVSQWKPLLKIKGVYLISDHYKVTTVPAGTYSLRAVIKDNYRALPLFNDNQGSDGVLVLNNSVKF